MMMMSPSAFQSQLPYGADERYAKKRGKVDALGAIDPRRVTAEDFAVLSENPFQVYACFLMAGSVLYYCLAGSLRSLNSTESFGMIGGVAESLGLLVLRQKIASRGNVKGISGKTMIMFALCYTSRLWELFPGFSMAAINGWVIEILCSVSFVLVLDIVRSIYVNFRSSYQEDLDVLKVRYLVPACAALALVIHPLLPQGYAFSLSWTIGFYVDVAALAPQVVMMAKGGGQVEAPIAHFVAATSVSRAVDLWFWTTDFDLGPQGWWNGFNYSGWIIVIVHVLNLVLVADFMWYYMKARLSGSGLSEDLSLPMDEMC